MLANVRSAKARLSELLSRAAAGRRCQARDEWKYRSSPSRGNLGKVRRLFRRSQPVELAQEGWIAFAKQDAGDAVGLGDEAAFEPAKQRRDAAQAVRGLPLRAATPLHATGTQVAGRALRIELTAAGLNRVAAGLIQAVLHMADAHREVVILAHHAVARIEVARGRDGHFFGAETTTTR